MIKTRINNEYKDIIKIFGGGTLQKEITKVWSREANKYVYESEVEYTGPLPITITADGTALIDYCIYGNTVQNGTPTPENPVDVVGCGVRTKNLFDKGSITQNYFMSQNGKVSSSTGAHSDYIPVQSNAQYYITRGVKSSSFYTACTYDSTKRFISYCNINSVSGVITTPNNCAYVIINLYKSTLNIAMFTAGSTAPASYIPYGYKLPLTLGSTTTDIYLGEVQSTRRVKKLVLTGSEDIWHKSSVCVGSVFAYLRDIAPNAVPFSPIVCTHLDNKPSYQYYRYGDGLIDENSLNLWLFNISVTITDFKAFLAQQYAAGTPVTVWYVLAEPETAVVNEPLMKIGDYADTLSMEQADVSIPTIDGDTTIDYDGAPKPSQMYIKYRR